MGADDAVLARVEGRAGRIVLNRPAALNALTGDMLHAVSRALATWRDDPAVHLVVVEGAGGRAFCAGGDVRSVRDWVLAGQFDRVEAFFADEYALNRLIARFPKPYVALVDGVCMGGGLGLSIHGAYRVVTERAMLAMPEVQIGLFPDVGAGYILPRLRGRFGTYLGLTGLRLSAADAVWLGLATHFVAHDAASGLAEGLSAEGLAALAERASPPPPSGLAAIADRVEAVFGLDDLPAIRAALGREPGEWAAAAAAAMDAASPAALRRTLWLLRNGAGWSLERCQYEELLLTREATRHPDFAEGVRAAVVDKDRAPRWAA